MTTSTDILQDWDESVSNGKKDQVMTYQSYKNPSLLKTWQFSKDQLMKIKKMLAANEWQLRSY